MAHGINSVLSNESCSITTARNSSSAKGSSVVTKTGIGSRRIFPAHFKLQVLDSYRNDADCKGNQRATARKYGIHRRQIQKWLQVEPNLRNSVVISSANTTTPNSGGGKHPPAKIVLENAMKSGFEEVSLKTPPPLQQCCRLRDDSTPEAYTQQQSHSSVGASEMVRDVAATAAAVERERQREEARVPSSSPDAYSECCYSPTASHSHNHTSRRAAGDEQPLDFTTHSRWYAGRHLLTTNNNNNTPTTILYPPSSSTFQSADDHPPCSPYYHSISSMTSSPNSSHQYEDTTTLLSSPLSSSTTTTSPLDLSLKPPPHSNNNDDVKPHTMMTSSYLLYNPAGSQLSPVNDDDDDDNDSSCPMMLKGEMLLVDRSVNNNDSIVWDLSMKDSKATLAVKRERESDDSSDNNNVSKPKPVKLFKPYLLDDTSSNSSSTTTSTSTTCKLEETTTANNSAYSSYGYNSSGGGLATTPQTSTSHHYNVTIYNNCYNNSPYYNNNAHLSTDYNHSNNNIYTVPNCSNSPPFYYGYSGSGSNVLLYPAGNDYGNNNHNNASNNGNNCSSVAVVPLKQRQSYSVDFKLRAINAYYRDDGCRGNQRAVAHKYNIHRRQIQKWLKQEEELRLRKTTTMTTTATSFASIVR